MLVHQKRTYTTMNSSSNVGDVPPHHQEIFSGGGTPGRSEATERVALAWIVLAFEVRGTIAILPFLRASV